MRQPQHAETRVVQSLHIGQAAFQILPAFGGKQRAGHALARRTVRQQAGQISRRLDDPQPAIGAFLHVVQLFGVPERAFQQAAPRADGLPLCHYQRGDIVGLARIFLVILPARRLRDAGKHLQCDIAGLQPFQVDMAITGFRQQIAFPHQRIAMQIDHGQRLVQRLGLGAHRPRRARLLVHSTLGDAWGKAEQAHRRHAEQRRRSPHQLLHRIPLIAVPA